MDSCLAVTRRQQRVIIDNPLKLVALEFETDGKKTILVGYADVVNKYSGDSFREAKIMSAMTCIKLYIYTNGQKLEGRLPRMYHNIKIQYPLLKSYINFDILSLSFVSKPLTMLPKSGSIEGELPFLPTSYSNVRIPNLCPA